MFSIKPPNENIFNISTFKKHDSRSYIIYFKIHSMVILTYF